MDKSQIKEQITEAVSNALNDTQDLITDEMNDAIETMDDVGHCWQLISDMACSSAPNDDLNAVNRDNMDSALDFLQREYWKASERLQLEMKNKLSINRRVHG